MFGCWRRGRCIRQSHLVVDGNRSLKRQFVELVVRGGLNHQLTTAANVSGGRCIFRNGPKLPTFRPGNRSFSIHEYGLEDVLDQIISRRVVAGERDCYVDWIDALRSVPGNPWRAAIRDFGDATAVVCAGCSARIINRCFGLSSASVRLIPEILAFFAEHQSDPSIDLDPFGDYGETFFATLCGQD